MTFLNNPNLPERLVNLAVIDERAGGETEKSLVNMGVRLLKIMPHPGLYKAVASHPDMLLHHIGGNIIIYAPGTDPVLIEILTSLGFNMLLGESELSPAYPRDIPYNVARVGGLYFHNLKYTDPVIKKCMDKIGVEPVHVEQGYSKCSILPVNNHTIITTDKGIAKAAEKKGLNSVLLAEERSIRLPGLNYGFIGGAGGMIGPSLCALNGDIDTLDEVAKLTEFLSSENINIKSLSFSPVTDIGSILPLLMHD